MNRRTQLLIGVAVVVLGLFVVSLGFASGESNVRRVEQVVAAPAAHTRGHYVLLGVPEPELIPLTGASGVELQPNPAWSDTTSTTVRWEKDGQTYYSTRSVTVNATGETAFWSFRNETRRLPSDPDLAWPAQTSNWTTTGQRVFAIQAFDDGDGDTPRVWGLYAGVLKDPMQPKPSQFTGHLLARLPDGSPVPDGAYLYDASEYKAGCSSKFLPPEEKARLDANSTAA